MYFNSGTQEITIINRSHHLNTRGGSDSIRVLIDTNVLILREDDRIIADNLASLIRVLSENNVPQLIHPSSIKEIEGDRDDRRREIMLSKIQTYSVLESPPDPGQDTTFLMALAEGLTKPKVDDHLLYAVHRNAVDCLITEDRGIHRKARRLGAQERVLTISEAHTLCLSIYQKKKKVIAPPAIYQVPVNNLNENDPIFDSLRADYSDFDEWLNNIMRKGRECWVHRFDDGSIGALLIFKEEDEAIDCIPPLPRTKRLKLCTFIVAPPLYGQKIGELFVRLAIDYCINQEIDETYLTHFVGEPDRLVDLIEEFGFHHAAQTKIGEELYLKHLVVDRDELHEIDPMVILHTYYPTFYDGRYVKKFFIPILPQYHELLFTDSLKRQTRITEFTGEYIIEGNTIKKAYLSHSSDTRISKGSIILFYRSKDEKALTSVGVVDEVHRGMKDPRKVMELVRKRTVYSEEEINQMVERPVLVILFRHIFHLRRRLTLGEMRRMDISGIPPQTITEVSENDYSIIKEACEIDERYTID
jgi:rRNA-processing protein FCF1